MAGQWMHQARCIAWEPWSTPQHPTTNSNGSLHHHGSPNTVVTPGVLTVSVRGMVFIQGGLRLVREIWRPYSTRVPQSSVFEGSLSLAWKTSSKPCTKLLYRELLQKFCVEISDRDLLKRSCTEILHRVLLRALPRCLLRRSCQRPPKECLCRDLAKRPCGELVQRPCKEISCGDLAKRSRTEILVRDLLKGAWTQISLRDLLQRSTEISERSFSESLRRSLGKISYSDFAKRSLEIHRARFLKQDLDSLTEILPDPSCAELVLRFCEETSFRDVADGLWTKSSCTDLAKRNPRGLLQRSCQDMFLESLYRGLAKRPLVEILCRDLVKRMEFLLRDLFQRAWREILCGGLLYRTHPRK